MKDIDDTLLEIGDYVEFRSSGVLHPEDATPFDKFGVIIDNEGADGSMIRIRYSEYGINRTQNKYPGNLRKLTDVNKIVLYILEN